MRRNLLNVLLIIVFVSPVWSLNTVSFTKHSVDENSDMGNDGNDGDLDFIAGASVSGVICWWENNLITGLNQQRGNTETIMEIVPNPANCNFSVSLANTYFGDVEIQIVNLSGDTELIEKVVKDKKSCRLN